MGRGGRAALQGRVSLAEDAASAAEGRPIKRALDELETNESESPSCRQERDKDWGNLASLNLLRKAGPASVNLLSPWTIAVVNLWRKAEREAELAT